MKRLGMLLGLILFMMASPAFAVDYEVEVQNLSSYETRKFTPPGNVNFRVPLSKSRWDCLYGKEERQGKDGFFRTILCANSRGDVVGTACITGKHTELGTSVLSLQRRHPQTGKPDGGHVITLICRWKEPF